MTYPEGAYWLSLLTKASLKRQQVKQVIHRWCVQEGRALAALFALPQGEAGERLGLDAETTARLWAAQASLSAQEALLQDAAHRGIGVLLRGDAAYPEALADLLAEERLPYVLFYQGDLTLLTEPGLVVSGAAAPDPEAQNLTRRLANALADDSYVLVSGYSRGVERLALDSARAAGGRTALVLPLGLSLCASMLGGMSPEIETGRTLALSPYALDAPYSDALAEARLPLVAALGEAMILVAPDLPPAECPSFGDALAAGKPALAWASAGDERLRAWCQAGAKPFTDAPEAVAKVREICGQLSGAADASHVATNESGDDAPPITFTDADAAVETLQRSGKVPDVLARRLRKTKWPTSD